MVVRTRRTPPAEIPKNRTTVLLATVRAGMLHAPMNSDEHSCCAGGPMTREVSDDSIDKLRNVDVAAG